MQMPGSAALVLFSGGQDSTTCLFWAIRHFERVEAVAFDYGQRHRIELQQAAAIAHQAGVPLTVLKLDTLAQLGGSALTDAAMAMPAAEPTAGELPTTFVPGRNLVFLTLAAAHAYLHHLRHLVLGVGEVDYSGYPDCRAPFLESAEKTLSLAMDCAFTLHAPLLHKSKAQIFQLAAELGCLDVVLQESHTCYNGDHHTRHAWGYGCGRCAACELRAKGYWSAFPAGV